ncbi:glycosyltransferase [Metabacillus rhizolycopersici]|uniref:Glycosyl transferase family 28 C-terminal domain-containing protein n=1 Tax=Metabacillus rhizolycopersici TaxID=2875709 RepID=A0ABS7ULL7_9BACI|nr:glycosyltransferase [Metabacillus rhizolycopersici]MBZ5749051.1 hypothetical protein [Metabacillus rhizolycopersici]
MKNIIYYISEYGYGHAARSIAIIRNILEQDSEIHIQVVHNYALEFLKESLRKNNVSFYNLATDIGYCLKDGSIEPDSSRQIHEVENYLLQMEDLLYSEINRLSSNNIDLIISDISPIAFNVADRLDVPSVGISNFTWYTAYQDLVPSEILVPIKESYEKMDYYFALAGSTNEEWGRMETVHFGFHSRRIDFVEVNRIRSTIRKDKQLVFIGFGMKMELTDLQNLSLWNSPDIHFIVSSNLNINHSNVSRIPHEYMETQNYMAACDLVITKAGWGTVGEAVVGKTPLLIIDRQLMREDKNTIAYLKKHKLCQIINWEELNNLVITDKFMDEMNKAYMVSNFSKTNEVGRIVEGIFTILERV